MTATTQVQAVCIGVIGGRLMIEANEWRRRGRSVRVLLESWIVGKLDWLNADYIHGTCKKRGRLCTSHIVEFRYNRQCVVKSG
jgi:hypothetical protein